MPQIEDEIPVGRIPNLGEAQDIDQVLKRYLKLDKEGLENFQDF